MSVSHTLSIGVCDTKRDIPWIHMGKYVIFHQELGWDCERHRNPVRQEIVKEFVSCKLDSIRYAIVRWLFSNNKQDNGVIDGIQV